MLCLLKILLFYSTFLEGVITSQLINDNSHWELLSMFNISDSDLPVAKYKSKLTGLTIVLTKTESPIVNGAFCLPTEAHDDDGLPHVLEHLIFLGSEDYPYKGTLDALADKCFAAGTNAWVETDYTCYTISTAGSSGFLNILPVFLDHILFPNLRSEDFLTEVHHINGEGQDAGVVYSEVKGMEPTVSYSYRTALIKRLYPGNSGYYARVGGDLENLRNSTTIANVRQYHKEFYRTENLILTITGKIDENQLFEKVRSIEEKVLKKNGLEPNFSFERPWQKPLQPTSYTLDFLFTHEFPSDDESKGHVLIGWRLKNHITKDIQILEAFELMLEYLISSEVSPFQKEFVESADPLSSSVTYEVLYYREPTLLIDFSNVPIKRIDEILPKMRKIIRRLLNEGPSKFDLERIHENIDRGIANNQLQSQDGPHSILLGATLLDKIYGHKEEHFEEFVVATQWSLAHRAHNASYWLELINEIFNKHLSIAVKAKPSLNLTNINKEKEKVRLERQIAELGPEGMKEKKQELETALATTMFPPNDVLAQIPLGDVAKIQFRSLNSYNRTLNPGNLFDFSGIPFKIHLDDVKSTFVTIHVYITLEGLTIKQQKHLPLLIDLWLRATSPIMKNGTLTDTEEVTKRYFKSLINLKVSQGYSYITISAQAEMDKLKEGVSFLSDRINYPHFTMKELNTTIGKHLNKRTPEAVSIWIELFNGLYFDNTTPMHYAGFQVQKHFLTKLKKEIRSNITSVLSDLYEIVDILAKPERSFVYIASNAEDLARVYGSDLTVFKKIFNSTSNNINDNLSERYKVRKEYEYRKKDLNNPRHVALGMDSTMSCYLLQSVLYNNTDWADKDVAAIKVLLQYLSRRLFNEVRGKGLAYGSHMSLSLSQGRITLGISRASRMVDAYNVVHTIFQNYLDGETPWEEELVESAKGAQIYSQTTLEETMTGLISQAALAYMIDTDSKYNRVFTKSLAKVNTDDVRAVAEGILGQFLIPNKTQTVVVCNKGEIDQVVDNLTNYGIDIKLYKSYEDTFLNFQ